MVHAPILCEASSGQLKRARERNNKILFWSCYKTWMDGWVVGRIDGWRNGKMDVWMDGWRNVGGIDGGLDGWRDGGRDE